MLCRVVSIGRKKEVKFTENRYVLVAECISGWRLLIGEVVEPLVLEVYDAACCVCVCSLWEVTFA